MNTTNLHTLFLRLTLTLCAILAAGLNGYADDIKTLNAIDGYYFYAASDLVCKKTLLRINSILEMQNQKLVKFWIILQKVV